MLFKRKELVAKVKSSQVVCMYDTIIKTHFIAPSIKNGPQSALQRIKNRSSNLQPKLHNKNKTKTKTNKKCTLSLPHFANGKLGSGAFIRNRRC